MLAKRLSLVIKFTAYSCRGYTLHKDNENLFILAGGPLPKGIIAKCCTILNINLSYLLNCIDCNNGQPHINQATDQCECIQSDQVPVSI